MNDVEFPVQRVLDGIEAAAAAGLPVKVNAVDQARAERPLDRGARAVLPRTGHIAALHRVHGRGRDERLAARRRRPGAPRSSSGSPRAAPRAGRGRATAARSRSAGATGRRRRDRRDPVGHAAVLRRLHARAHLGRGLALHLPLRRSTATTCAPRCAAARPTTSCATLRSDLAGKRTDRYSELRSQATAALRKVEMSYIGG